MRSDAIWRALRGVRRRLLWAFVAFAVGASLTWQYRVEIFGYLLAPANGQLGVDGKPIFTAPTDMFTLTVKMAVKGGILVALPVGVYNVFGFFRPLLNKHQRRTILFFLVLGFFFGLSGVAFAYFVVLPTGLDFMLGFGTDIATPMIEITEYMKPVLAMLFWMGVAFQIPVIMLLLAKWRIVSHTQFAKMRLYVPIAAVLLGMIITPTPDFVNQLLVAGPVWLLYEVGVFLSWLARPKVRG